jgi:hypothetical protein
MNWLGLSEHKLGVDKWNICLVQAAASVGSSQAPTPPWTTLHLSQPTRNPFINRGKLFKQTGITSI